MTAHTRRVLAIATAGLALLGAPATAPATPERAVTVMTRNLYLGADLAPILSATSLPALAAAVEQAYASVQATSFPERAEALADEIAQTRPDLIGLQEAVLWQTDSPSDGPLTQATTVAYDFLGLLLGELEERGLPYRAVAQFTGFDGEVPSAAGIDVRLTDRDVVLAREGLVTARPRSGAYATNLVVPTPFGPPATITRGWSTVDAVVEGVRFRFATTHLEPTSEPVQVAQTAELLGTLASTGLPVVLLGDFNSRADGTGTRTYGDVLAAGYEDAWSRLHPGEPGFTCCHDTDLRNPLPTLDERIDLVFTRGTAAVAAEVVGDEPADRTPSGLWPSDHAGVVARVELPGPDSFVIVRDRRIGGYPVKADGSLGGATAAFGQPASLVRQGETCRARWPSLGLRIGFYNLGGFDPCTPDGGRFSNAVLTGPAWQTDRGLEIGAPLRELRRLYPKATYHRDEGYGPGWWLIARLTPFALYPGLVARIQDGRVTAFVVRYPAGGE